MSVLLSAAVPAGSADLTSTQQLASGVVLRRFSRLVAGRVLVRDVASLAYGGTPEAFDAAGCERHCFRTPGCNAWAVCSYDPATMAGKVHPGCGAGCLAYKATATDYAAPDADIHVERCSTFCSVRMANVPPLPADFAGPFNAIRLCAWGCRDNKVCQPSDSAPGSCTYPDCLYREQKYETDRWALGKCTLLQVDAANPALVQGEAGSGWVSGTISNPTGCSDVSAHTCEQCHKLAGGSAAAAAEGCRACIRAKNVTAALEVSMGDMAEIWCKGPDGLYAMIAADGNTRFSEFGCLYDVGVVMQGASVKTAGASRTECEARRVRDVCQDEDYTC
ncbi:hypothetical protein OEZ85_003499 [Tetradesmus obliquus]|uniref:Apple domain-containing protein n=1 Tax=Tetradesmus obliquus TaxID=3088 RepID=A0ABY8UDU1_TETOB|nr:hypothetical protein OEZ85_003499 [Tetradesmus obliquus]